MLLIIQRQDFKKLLIIGRISITCVFTFVILLVIYMTHEVQNDTLQPIKIDVLIPKAKLETVAGLPTMFLAFCFQYNWGSFRDQLDNRSRKTIHNTLLTAIILVTIIMMVVGVTSVLAFGTDLRTKVIDNFKNLDQTNQLFKNLSTVAMIC